MSEVVASVPSGQASPGADLTNIETRSALADVRKHLTARAVAWKKLDGALALAFWERCS
jgi:hypothetical protein